MNTYKIAREDGVVRFGQKDQSDPKAFDLGYHELNFTEDRFSIQEIEGGFVARLIETGDEDPIEYTVTAVVPEDAQIAFEGTHRTFDSSASIDAYMTKKFKQEASYIPEDRRSFENISVVLDGQSSPVALIKEDGDETFIREDSEWIEVIADEYPEIFGQMVSIDQDDTTYALSAWDTAKMSGDPLDIIFNYVEA